MCMYVRAIALLKLVDLKPRWCQGVYISDKKSTQRSKVVVRRFRKKNDAIRVKPVIDKRKSSCYGAFCRKGLYWHATLQEGRVAHVLCWGSHPPTFVTRQSPLVTNRCRSRALKDLDASTKRRRTRIHMHTRFYAHRWRRIMRAIERSQTGR